MKASQPRLKPETRAFKIAAEQFHIKALFIKVPETDVGSILQAGTVLNTKEKKNIVGIISADQMQLLLRKFRSGGATIMSEPEVVTRSGRQTQMGTGETAVDLVPTLFDDGNTLKMTVSVSAPETLSAQVNAWNGQTIVLAPNNSIDGKTRLLVLVKTDLVDPAGNWIRPKKELPSNPAAVPPQE